MKLPIDNDTKSTPSTQTKNAKPFVSSNPNTTQKVAEAETELPWLGVAPPTWILQKGHHLTNPSTEKSPVKLSQPKNPWYFTAPLRHPQDLINLKPEGFIGYNNDGQNK